MLVVIDLDRRIDAATHRDLLHQTIFAGDLQCEILLRFDRRAEADDVVNFRAVELQRLRRRAFLELRAAARPLPTRLER